MLRGALAFLLLFVTLTAVVRENHFDRIDRSARSRVHQPGSPLLQTSMEAASFLGGESGQVTVVLLGVALLWRRRRRWGLGLPVVMAGVGLLQLVAKWAIDRPRPNLDPWGFPSAHVLSLVVLLGYLAYVVSSSRARPTWRGIVLGSCAAIVATVAFSRMYLDAHWLSDILGGLSLGLAYLLAVLWLIRAVSAPWRVLGFRTARTASGVTGLQPAAAPLEVATAGS